MLISIEEIRERREKEREIVSAAKSYLDENDPIIKKFNPPILVEKSCATCWYWRQKQCIFYSAPLLVRWAVKKKQTPQGLAQSSIPLLDKQAKHMHCKEWLEIELAKLLLSFGYHPGAIAYMRRHPEVSSSITGRIRFATRIFLNYLKR